MPLKAQAALNKDRTMPSGKAVMQHRHFAVIADVIMSLPLDTGKKAVVTQHFADYLAATNPRFDRARFVRACGMEVK